MAAFLPVAKTVAVDQPRFPLAAAGSGRASAAAIAGRGPLRTPSQRDTRLRGRSR